MIALPGNDDIPDRRGASTRTARKRPAAQA